MIRECLSFIMKVVKGVRQKEILCNVHKSPNPNVGVGSTFGCPHGVLPEPLDYYCVPEDTPITSYYCSLCNPRIVQCTDGSWTNLVEFQYLTDEEKRKVLGMPLVMLDEVQARHLVLLESKIIENQIEIENDYWEALLHDIGEKYPSLQEEFPLLLLGSYSEIARVIKDRE